MKVDWISYEEGGDGYSLHVTGSEIGNIAVINGLIKFENLRTGGMSKEQFEKALSEFIAKVSID